MKKRSILLLLLLSNTFTIKSATEPTASKNTANKEIQHNFDDIVFDWSGTFAEVLRTSGDKHYKIANPQECIIKSINTFLNCLDPHSSFLDPKTYKAILEMTSGQFFGIGIVIDNTRSSKDKHLNVINTIPNGPAEKAGVKQYDKIIEIDGKKLEGMTTEEATTKLRGEKGTKVAIKVLRENKKAPLPFEITRDVVKAQSSIAFYLKEHDIYYVSLSTFSNNAVKQIRDILEKATKKSYKGLILDLRNNSGGLLNAVIDIAGLFLDKGSSVVITKDKHDKTMAEYKTTINPVANVDIPIFILVNNYTASASEILAGCLKVHSNDLSKKSKNGQKKLFTFIVGSKTFGKGSVQEVIPISNDCAIKLTTSLYFLPDDTTIQGKGIIPDFPIERLFPPPEKLVWFTKHYGREKTLKHSIKTNGTKNKKNKNEPKDKDKKTETWTERLKKSLEKDNQFIETIRLINVFNMVKQANPSAINTREKAVAYLKNLFALNGSLDMVEFKI